jgi:hypothetical protein
MTSAKRFLLYSLFVICLTACCKQDRYDQIVNIDPLLLVGMPENVEKVTEAISLDMFDNIDIADVSVWGSWTEGGKYSQLSNVDVYFFLGS